MNTTPKTSKTNLKHWGIDDPVSEYSLVETDNETRPVGTPREHEKLNSIMAKDELFFNTIVPGG